MAKSIHFTQSGRHVQVQTSANVLTALLAERVPVKMACGGRGLCATCHVYVEEGADALTPRSRREERTLGLVSGANEHSRLACQAKVLAEGVAVRLPEGLFIERSGDLTELIGRRAEAPILHPIDGRCLVQRGKIITRSTIRKLESVEADVQALLARSREASR